MQERLTRNRLTLAYLADDVIGNATIRPATPDAPAIVIVRILPQYRRRGHGTEYWTRLTTEDPTLQSCDLGTVVLVANTDGVRFAQSLGFVETDGYDVASVMFIDMTRAA